MIAISGAEGFNGQEIIRQLVAAGEPVRALLVDPAKSDAVRRLGAEPMAVDAEAGLARGLQGVERAVLVPPNTEDQVERERTFIEAAKQARVSRLVKFSAAGADLASDAVILSRHAHAEKMLQDSGVGFTIVRPHWFMQNLIPLAPAILASGAIALPMGEGRTAAVDMRDIAAVITAALTRPGHEGRTYLVTGPAPLSFADIGAQLGEVAGRRVRYEAVSDDAFRTTLIGYGTPAWLADGLVGLFRTIRNGDQDEVTSTVADVTGRPARSLRQFLQDNKAAFGA